MAVAGQETFAKKHRHDDGQHQWEGDANGPRGRRGFGRFNVAILCVQTGILKLRK